MRHTTKKLKSFMASSTLKPDFVILKLLGGTGDVMAKKKVVPVVEVVVDAVPTTNVPEVNADGFNVAE